MRLTVFHATDGDCLMLESATGERVLIDGGRGGSFKQHTLPVLEELVAAKKAIDLPVVSHIDADHISGVIPLLDAVGQWAGYKHRLATARAAERATLPAPSVPKPPRIKGLWHNSWRNQLGELADPVAALARSVREAVSLTADESQQPPIPAALAMSDLATSMEQGELLIDLVEQAGLPIAFNVPFEGMVMLRDPVHTQKVGRGSMKLSVLGPSQEHLDTLREEWQQWVDNLPDTAPSRPSGRHGGLSLAEGLTLESAVESAKSIIASVTKSARSIAREVESSPDASKVTPPNRASIVLLAEEKGRSCLLTGDAAEPEILDGLKAAKKFTGDRFRCNVLKVQHHGSEHNLGSDFAKTVIADHYVFCGDGASGNPNPDVITAITEARRVVEPETPYTLWFNTSETRPKSKKKQGVMKAALAKARKAATEHPDLVNVEVLNDADSALTIDV